MSKRSTRIAKRDEFENALKEVEEKLRLRREKNPEAVVPTGTEEGDGEGGALVLPRRRRESLLARAGMGAGRPSGAEARILHVRFTPRLKPCPSRPRFGNEQRNGVGF